MDTIIVALVPAYGYVTLTPHRDTPEHLSFQRDGHGRVSCYWPAGDTEGPADWVRRNAGTML